MTNCASELLPSLQTLLDCDHQDSVAVYTLARFGSPLEVCTSCGARREPESSRPEWMVPDFLRQVQFEARSDGGDEPASRRAWPAVDWELWGNIYHDGTGLIWPTREQAIEQAASSRAEGAGGEITVALVEGRHLRVAEQAVKALQGAVEGQLTASAPRRQDGEG